MLRQNIKERINTMQKFTTILVFCLLFPFLANAFTVKHNFFVTVGIFDTSKTEFSYTLNKNNYKISSIVKTNGFLRFLTYENTENAQYTTAKSRANLTLKTVKTTPKTVNIAVKITYNGLFFSAQTNSRVLYEVCCNI
jgi:hypothetical protein